MAALSRGQRHQAGREDGLWREHEDLKEGDGLCPGRLRVRTPHRCHPRGQLTGGHGTWFPRMVLLKNSIRRTVLRDRPPQHPDCCGTFHRVAWDPRGEAHGPRPRTQERSRTRLGKPQLHRRGLKLSSAVVMRCCENHQPLCMCV